MWVPLFFVVGVRQSTWHPGAPVVSLHPQKRQTRARAPMSTTVVDMSTTVVDMSTTVVDMYVNNCCRRVRQQLL
eukprot:1199487-Pyramimonas_sp.AAC.1